MNSLERRFHSNEQKALRGFFNCWPRMSRKTRVQFESAFVRRGNVSELFFSTLARSFSSTWNPECIVVLGRIKHLDLYTRRAFETYETRECARVTKAAIAGGARADKEIRAEISNTREILVRENLVLVAKEEARRRFRSAAR